MALNNNEIIGICGYDREKVHTLFVDINHQKEGIGKKLLTKILDEAKNEGLKSIKTWSTFYAEKFYNSFGFIKREEIYFQELMNIYKYRQYVYILDNLIGKGVNIFQVSLKYSPNFLRYIFLN